MVDIFAWSTILASVTLPMLNRQLFKSVLYVLPYFYFSKMNIWLIIRNALTSLKRLNEADHFIFQFRIHFFTNFKVSKFHLSFLLQIEYAEVHFPKKWLKRFFAASSSLRRPEREREGDEKEWESEGEREKGRERGEQNEWIFVLFDRGGGETCVEFL